MFLRSQSLEPDLPVGHLKRRKVPPGTGPLSRASNVKALTSLSSNRPSWRNGAYFRISSDAEPPHIRRLWIGETCFREMAALVSDLTGKYHK